MDAVMGRTLDKGVLIGLGLVLALLVVIPVLNHWNTNQLNEDARWVAHTQEVLGLTADVLLTLVDAETGQRGFIITGKDDFLQPYNAALVRLDERLAKLKDKTKDNPRQQANIRKLAAMTTKCLVLLEEGIALRRKSEQEAQAFISAKKGKEQMDAIRELVAEMKREETDLLGEREARSSFAYQTAVTTGLLSALLGLGLFGVFVWLLRRSLMARQKAAAVLHEQREWFQHDAGEHRGCRDRHGHRGSRGVPELGGRNPDGLEGGGGQGASPSKSCSASSTRTPASRSRTPHSVRSRRAGLSVWRTIPS